MSNQVRTAVDFTLAHYSGDRASGAIVIVERRGGHTGIEPIESLPGSGLDKALKPIFIGLTEAHQVIVMEPREKRLSIQSGFPVDAFAAHIYSDPSSARDWFMNDGDKATGNDTLNCGDKGSSVTVVESTASPDVSFLKTICVGRGHHQAAFGFPSPQAPAVPHRAYISNLKDGTITVIGNDPGDAETFLEVVATINLCEPDKEEGGAVTVPNNAFPHGLAYSSQSGKLYNLNNGYGTIAVIDPVTNEIEKRIPFKGHSNLLVTPDGRYLIGRGADRKSDANHVFANLSVLDALSGKITDAIKIPDVYISKYYFNADGSKLYLTTSSSGSPEQQANLKSDALLIFDLAALPKLKVAAELRLGASSGSLAFLNRDGVTDLVFSSNSEDGSVAVIGGVDDTILETIAVGPAQSHSRIWMVGD
jgi:DNA-binding beta-propeller fold protein YncE